MKITKVLNLYAGLGGNRKLWENAQVTAIEQNEELARIYKKLYPLDIVIVTDAHQYLINHYKEYNFIWSSPPCQSHSRMNYIIESVKPQFPDLKLYQEIIFLKQFCPGRFAVENVQPYYKPLIAPSTSIGRHLFWSNFDILQFPAPHLPNMFNLNTIADSKILQNWLDIHYDKPIYLDNTHNCCQVLRNCVHPEIGLHIFSESLRFGLFQSLDL